VSAPTFIMEYWLSLRLSSLLRSFTSSFYSIL
jgi:hypothetical protein